MRVQSAEDTGRFASHFDLYLNMIEMQLTYDVLRTSLPRSRAVRNACRWFRFLGDLSRAGKSRKRDLWLGDI